MKKVRNTNRQREKTGKLKSRQTNRQTDRQTNRRAAKQTLKGDKQADMKQKEGRDIIH